MCRGGGYIRRGQHIGLHHNPYTRIHTQRLTLIYIYTHTYTNTDMVQMASLFKQKYWGRSFGDKDEETKKEKVERAKAATTIIKFMRLAHANLRMGMFKELIDLHARGAHADCEVGMCRCSTCVAIKGGCLRLSICWECVEPSIEQ